MTTLPAPPPASGDSTSRALKIVVGIGLGMLVLCGLLGSCLLLATFFLPGGGQ